MTFADCETAITAMEKGPRVDNLRRLFFPTKADHDEGTITGILSLNQKWFNQWSLPQLRNRFTTGSTDVGGAGGGEARGAVGEVRTSDGAICTMRRRFRRLKPTGILWWTRAGETTG